MKSTTSLLFTLLICFSFGISSGQDVVSKETVLTTMAKAATYYRNNVAVNGGYVYHYSLDLKERWGEGPANPQQIWVQPPGTPTVGMAFLKAYEATGDNFYLYAARDAAMALAYGQLKTGGWSNQIDFNSLDLKKFGTKDYRYRDSHSSLDDGQTQSATQLMVKVDAAFKFQHPHIHQSAKRALDALLAAQFPNGGFPQVWRGPVEKQPILKANYPNYDWRTEGRIKNYWDYYTLNDNVCGYVTDTLITAHEVYKDPRYLEALARLGDFLILAQMPDPQPAWAQQYNYNMQPMWARRFEPAAISGDESEEVIETLMKIAVATGNNKYLQPIPKALNYLKKSELPDGQLARFYELKTNRPLYMVRKSKKVYQLTYDDSNLPSHYGWKMNSHINQLTLKYNALVKNLSQGHPPTKVKTSEVTLILQSLDPQGRWISTHDGRKLVGQAKFPLNAKYLSSAVFSENLTTLSNYLISQRK